MFVKMVPMHPDMWFDIPVGSINTERAPKRITTGIKVSYQQKQESYCMVYGLSSALVHCEYKTEARQLSQHAEIKKIATIIPIIGKIIMFNLHIKKQNKGSHN